MRIEKNDLVKSAARILGLVYSVNPDERLIFSDCKGNATEFDPLMNAEDCEKLIIVMRPTVSHFKDGVSVLYDKNKPYSCLLDDFEEPKVLNAYRFCVAYAAHKEAEKLYGERFV